MIATTRSRRGLKVGVVALVILTITGAYHVGILARVAEPKLLAQMLVEMGAWGHLAFVVAYAVLQPFGAPGTIFIVAAPLIWPWQTAFAVSLIGTMFASVVGFSFARLVAKDWVSARIPARLRKYDESLERNAFWTVVLLRFILWMPQALHFYLGVSKVRFWNHFWGSLVGYVPPLLLVSYLGDEMFDASGKLQPGAWPILAGLVGVSLAIALLARTYERCRRSGRSVQALQDAQDGVSALSSR